MDCLKNFIGIRGCGNTQPDSGLFINDLAGINLKSIDAVVNAEQTTFLNVWRDVQLRAGRRFETDVTSYLRRKYKINKLFDQFQFGRVYDESNVRPMSDEFRGVEIELSPYNQQQPEMSPFMTIVLTRFRYWATADQTITFVIANSEQQIELTTVTVDVIANQWNDVFAEFKTDALSTPRSISVGYNAIDVDSVKTEITANTGRATSGCGCTFAIPDVCDGRIRGIVYDNATGEQTFVNDNGFGLSGFAALRCGYDGLICSNRSIFASAFWYLCGVEMLVERKFTDRVNKYSTIDKKKADELHEYYLERYQNEIDVVLDTLDLNDYDCCIDCNPVVSRVETMP